MVNGVARRFRQPLPARAWAVATGAGVVGQVRRQPPPDKKAVQWGKQGCYQPHHDPCGYTRHTSSCLRVVFVTRLIHKPRPYGPSGYGVQICSGQICRSPQSHSYLCSWGLTLLSPLSNPNYLWYMCSPRLFYIFKINGFNYSIHVYYVFSDLLTFMRAIFCISSSASENNNHPHR